MFAASGHTGTSKFQVIYFLAEDVKIQERVDYREPKNKPAFFATAVSFEKQSMKAIRNKFNLFVQGRKKEEHKLELKNLKKQQYQKTIEGLIPNYKAIRAQLDKTVTLVQDKPNNQLTKTPRLRKFQGSDLSVMRKTFNLINKVPQRYLIQCRLTRQYCFIFWRRVLQLKGLF